MDGCGSWTELLSGCLGRGRKTEVELVELTPQRNPYGRSLINLTLTTPGGKASLEHPERSRRPSQDLGDIAHRSNNGDSAPPVQDHREYDNAWHEMLDSLHGALKHTRYAISGRMAMTVWRCHKDVRDTVSVICPLESKEAVKIWVISTGGWFAITDDEPHILTFRSQGGRGHCSTSGSQPGLWRIRIRWLSERMFEAMPKVETRLLYNENPYTGEYQTACVNVLTLPALLDNSAGAWAAKLARGVSNERLVVVARDILLILDRIIELSFREEGSGPLSASESRHVLDRAFWAPFTRRYQNAPAKFAQCGLGLPSYMRSQPGPQGGMVCPGATPERRSKDVGRSLMGRRQNVPERSGQPEMVEAPPAAPEKLLPKPTLRNLLSAADRKEAQAAQAERERRERENAGQLEDQFTIRTRKLEKQETKRKRERRA